VGSSALQVGERYRDWGLATLARADRYACSSGIRELVTFAELELEGLSWIRDRKASRPRA
jgi:hypothetical protein